MNWLVYFFGSGLAFFAGTCLLVSGLSLGWIGKRSIVRGLRRVTVFIGLIFVVLSAAPLPIWYYVLLGVACLSWPVIEGKHSEKLQRIRTFLRLAVLLITLAGVAVEIPWHFMPRIPPADGKRLYIIGDSVAAGTGENSIKTWPALLAKEESIEVVDLSEMGAMVRNAIRKAESVEIGTGLILIEIGGNDLLGTSTAQDFENDLSRLLELLRGKGRALVMFELPLPPFANEFGRVQRRLAAKHQVTLIPKRVFINILTTNGATGDSVHLTQFGHELMSQVVWKLIRPAFRDFSPAGTI